MCHKDVASLLQGVVNTQKTNKKTHHTLLGRSEVQLEYCVQVWAPQHKKGQGQAEGAVKGHRDGEGAGASLSQGETAGAGPVQSGEDEGNAHKYLKGGARHFSVLPTDRTRSNGHKLKHKST